VGKERALSKSGGHGTGTRCLPGHDDKLSREVFVSMTIYDTLLCPDRAVRCGLKRRERGSYRGCAASHRTASLSCCRRISS
jgi:hypothetical protein